MDYYKTTYDAWYDSISVRRAYAEVMLRTNIGSEQWYIGDIEEAHQTIAGVVALAEKASRSDRTPVLINEHANALWTLGLIFRSLSDIRDGDKGYLHDAIERFRKSINLYKRIGAESYQVGRISIQIAEAYLDLAELHLNMIKPESARSMNPQANAFVEQAADFLLPTDDPEGRVLARITQLLNDQNARD